MKKCMGCMQDYEDDLKVCPHCGYEEGTPPKEAYHMEPGSVLHGHYIVGKVVGYGGFGVTYIGFDAELERRVAIKEYMPSEFSTRIPGQTIVTVYAGDKAEQFQTGLEKFVDEAKRLAKFQNMMGVVQIYDSFMENETAYIIMEYLEGETLKEKLERDGKMELEDALNVILPILSSLKEIHKIGIIHRDIAPDNIMLTKDGEVKLIDFGASRFATTTHSRSLTVLIKQGYAPTEQYNSRGDQGPWTDVYALAATFYKCLTGVTPEDSMERKAKDHMKAPSKLGAKVSKNMDTAIMNAMNIGIEYRTSSMEKFEEELLSEKEVSRIVEPNKKEDTGKMPLWARLLIGTVGAAIATFVILIITGVIDFGSLTADRFSVSKGMTYVPNVVNQEYETAKRLAEENAMSIQQADSQYSDTIPRNWVYAQSPDVGYEVEEGTVLVVAMSLGKQQVIVPSVEGLMHEEAIRLLEECGLSYELKDVDSNVAEGAVVTQSIASGEVVDIGTIVMLGVSTGVLADVDTTIEVEVPDLTDMSFTQAQELLNDLKLYIVKETETYSSTIQQGNIISHDPEKGTIVHQGDTIRVTVSKGIQRAFVEDVWLKEEAYAKEIMENNGLTVEIRYEENEDVRVGCVISQSIEANTYVDWGSKIVLVVSKGSTIANNPAGNTQEKKAEATEMPEPTLTPTPIPTNTPTPIPTPKTQYRYYELETTTSSDPNLASQGWSLTDTTYGAYGDWIRTDVAVYASDTRNVTGPTTYYKYQNYRWDYQESTASSMDGYSQYGSYISWGNEYESTDGTNNELRKATVSYTVPAQTHSIYHYYRYCSGPSSDRGGPDTSAGSYRDTRTTTSPVQGQTATTSNGYTVTVYYIDSKPFFWDYEEVITDRDSYTVYKVQDGVKIYQYRKLVEDGPVSDWTTEALTDTETKKCVVTTNWWFYQDRTVTYHYERWSGPSEWSYTPIEATPTRKVETRQEPQ